MFGQRRYTTKSVKHQPYTDRLSVFLFWIFSKEFAFKIKSPLFSKTEAPILEILLLYSFFLFWKLFCLFFLVEIFPQPIFSIISYY